MKVSVIIPTFNEEKVIDNCLQSLFKQTLKVLEIIVVDDGSTDHTVSKISKISRDAKFLHEVHNLKSQFSNLFLLEQKHKGPGAARNLGVSKAKGEILVFVDADMEFESDFLEKLIAPIQLGKTIGTFSKEEYLLNKDNVWALCWNRQRFGQSERMVPQNYPDTAPVFRAILKRKFVQAGGFDTQVGYTDDWSLSRKLKTQATAATGAKFYHRNPESLTEVWQQARWFGKNEFLTKNFVRRIYNLARYFPPLALLRLNNPTCFVFTLVYKSAVFTSVFLSFFGEAKSK